MFESPQNDQKKRTTRWVILFFGGLEEIRTPDPHNANVVRSQLRYKPLLPGYYSAGLFVCQAGISA